MKGLISAVVLLLTLSIQAQVVPPCGNVYGSTADETNIISNMRYGSISDAVNAINQAKNTRGTALGCTEQSLAYATADITGPTLADIETVWNTVHAPAISAYSVSCPRIGRYENNAALGAYYAMQAGYYTDTAKLAEIADMMYDQQYALWNIASPDARNEGVFGYVNVAAADPCNPGGVVGSSVATLCATLPVYCVSYTAGQFAGESFAISGQDDANNWFDGGLAYDHGWIGIQMIEASIMQSDLALKQKYRNSVELAGQYSLAEYCVKNHNYTAKQIWLLSELYAWTGDTTYRNELNYKLDKSLLPGILLDDDNDGFVDATTPPIAFSSLTVAAQTPGRMWDGHNSTPWYQAMNTWALAEAYIAFRDRGDVTRANELKPAVVAMMDNLSDDIINQGVITPDALGVRDITYAILNSIWKISQYENEAHLNWEQAAWAMWNTGYFNSYSTHSVCVGQYLLVKSSTPYQPLSDRENFVLSSGMINSIDSKIELYPNPASDQIELVVESRFIGLDYSVFDQVGQLVLTGIISSVSSTIELGRLSDGVYFLVVGSESKRGVKFVKG
jgi:hypothetical protein